MHKNYFLILLFSIITNSLAQEKQVNIVTQLQQRALGQRSTFNLRNFELFRVLPNDVRKITSIEFSRNGLLAIAINFQANIAIRIYDSAGELLKDLASNYEIKNMSWSENGRYLLTLSDPGWNLLGIWDIEKETYMPIDYLRDLNGRKYDQIIYAGFIGNDKIFIYTESGNMKIYDLQAKRVIAEERCADIRGYSKIRLTPDHTKIIIRLDQRDRLTIFDLKTRRFQTLNFEHMAHDYFFSYYGDFLYVVQKNEHPEELGLATKLTIINLRTMKVLENNVNCPLDFDKCRCANTQFITPEIALVQIADVMLFFDFEQNKEIYYKKLNNNNLMWVKATHNNLMAFQFNRCVIVYKIYDVNKIASLI